jgi:uncharacterized protein
MMRTLEDIVHYAMTCFVNAPGSHDWEHTRRVRNLCRHIGTVEGADLEVLEIAAYLHDIGRAGEQPAKGTRCHAEKGAQMAGEILKGYSIGGAKRENIIHCIRNHRFRGKQLPETLEAKVLFDADKLDAIGAVGIARAYLFAGELGAKLHNPDMRPEDTEAYSREDTGYREYRLKLSKIKERMLTREGRRMAEERHRFMEAFFERFVSEYEGGR